jgi:ATPase
MSRYIKNIHIKQVRHLKDINIPLEKEDYPHLMITGKNGSGKTSLLNAIADYIEEILTNHDAILKLKTVENAPTIGIEEELSIYKKLHSHIFGNLAVEFDNIFHIVRSPIQKNFIIAFYEAHRTIRKLEETNTPTKPFLNKRWKVKEISTKELLNFLSDLKIQEALARNEKLETDAEQINEWFIAFENLLGKIFQDENLKLTFNYKNYSFKILTKGKEFKFTELSDGFAAVLDIVVDLILKMQEENQLTKAYELEGIVLVDEIETHLHLELQKAIMPLLTKIFPNIQFIVTTHSPFVLSSLSNAVAFDLEHQEIIEDLTEYSYESLAEGYFGVKTASSYMGMQLGRLEELLKKESYSL